MENPYELYLEIGMKDNLGMRETLPAVVACGYYGGVGSLRSE